MPSCNKTFDGVLASVMVRHRKGIQLIKNPSKMAKVYSWGLA